MPKGIVALKCRSISLAKKNFNYIHSPSSKVSLERMRWYSIMEEAFLRKQFTRLSYSLSFSWKGSPYTIFLSFLVLEFSRSSLCSLRMGLHFPKWLRIYITFVCERSNFVYRMVRLGIGTPELDQNG